MSRLFIQDEEQLDLLLSRMNETGMTPTVIGLDERGLPFLAYGYAPSGDDWATGVLHDDPRSSEFDYNDTKRCEECGAFDRRPISVINYPVEVFHSETLPLTSPSFPEGEEL